MSEQQMNSEKYFRLFEQAPKGTTLRIPLSSLTPSQTPDGRYSSSTGLPLEAFIDNGKILISNGNHRYHDALKVDPVETTFLNVVKVSNPYIEY